VLIRKLVGYVRVIVAFTNLCKVRIEENSNCKFFGTRYTGKDIWKVLLDELELGVFD